MLLQLSLLTHNATGFYISYSHEAVSCLLSVQCLPFCFRFAFSFVEFLSNSVILFVFFCFVLIIVILRPEGFPLENELDLYII